MYHHLRWTALSVRECAVPKRLLVRELARRMVTSGGSRGQSVMLYQQVSPPPAPTGLYACCFTDAVEGVQSVRPAHLGSHQEVRRWVLSMRM
jgi:hypothetical protein